MPELPETKEDIEWKYYYCKDCDTETGYFGELSNACCAKCTLEKADIVKEYCVQMNYGDTQEIRANAELAKLELEADNSPVDDASTTAVLGTGRLTCLKDCIKTDDLDTIKAIEKECASHGCNVCLSQTTDDTIEWPKHYNMGKIQPIDAIEDWKLDFRLANSVKYIARAGRKDPNSVKQDLEKAIWYIKRFIDKECN